MIIFTYICLIKIITIMNDKGLTFGEAIEAVKNGMEKGCLFFSVLKTVCLQTWS